MCLETYYGIDITDRLVKQVDNVCNYSTTVRRQERAAERERNIIFMLKNGMEAVLRNSPDYSDEEIDRAKKKLLQPVE